MASKRSRPRSLGVLLVGFVCAISATLDDKQSLDSTSYIPTLIPTPTPANPSREALSSGSIARPLVTELGINLDRRDLDIIIASMGSLQLALASASTSATSLSDGLSSALSISEELVSSLDGLRSSTESLSSSASRALLSARASASSAISSVEASAARALSAAQESAASGISEAVALATSLGPKIGNETHQAQKSVSHEDTTVSPAVVGGAVAASVVGSSFVSFLVFWFCQRKRKAKQREREEENEVNAALDRAIVSYIVNEHPIPQGSAAYGSSRRAAHSEGNVAEDLPLSDEKANHLEPASAWPASPTSPSFLVPSASISQSLTEPQPALAPPPRPQLALQSRQPMHPRRDSRSPRRPPRPPRPGTFSLQQEVSTSPPLPQSPRAMLPAKPRKHSYSFSSVASSSANSAVCDARMETSSAGISRVFSRSTASSYSIDSAGKVYGAILASPLEIPSHPPPRKRPRRNTEPPERVNIPPTGRREDVGWPLTKQMWL
ncbi:hypothetical protein QBC42DRAFT_69987 [Cladorrhinum samala]|uniref:Transmembrane protein n=1 Tax=Cladorrhinum samala TaxID=585594 RepID=A0AAV9HSV9_9PEZI|nr:hypothetical protein QBC42DRAFT_69987 [Cladorrhinum samala]